MNDKVNETENNISSEKTKKIFDAITEVSEERIEEAKGTSLKGEFSPLRLFRAKKTWGIIAAGLLGAVIVPVALMTMTDAPVIDPVDSDTTTGTEAIESDDDDIDIERVFPDDHLVSEVKPMKAAGRAIETDTSFTLETSVDVSISELSSMLRLEPDIPFNLEKKTDGTFNLVTEEAFETNSIVKILLLNEDGSTSQSWAFQTIDIFRISSVFPANESTDAPVNTGIEVTFSQSVSLSEYEKHFEISPPVEGKFQMVKSSLIFVPESSLKQNTVYTVTLKSGLISESGKVLEEDYVFKFKTNNISPYYCYVADGITETFLPDDPVLVEFYASPVIYNAPLQITLYKYNNASEYTNTLTGYINDKTWETDYYLSTEGLQEMYSAEETALRGPDASAYSPSYIMLPDNLEVGYYLADISANGDEYRMQKLIQINPVSVYAGKLPDEAAFFVNDTVTGKPAASAVITFDIDGNTRTASVMADGTALLNTAGYGDDYNGIVKIEYGGYTYLDLFDIRTADERDPMEDYYFYIYTDREAYMATDTVNVWGMILPRSKDAVMPPEDLYIMEAYGKSDGIYTPFTLGPDGTFKTSLTFKNHVDSWWSSVKIMSGDKMLCNKSVKIKDYVKPTYVVDGTFPMFAWLPQENPVEFSLNASFYDGTPAVGLPFNITNVKTPGVTVTTDKNGYAEASVLANDVEAHYGWQPYPLYIGVDMAGVQNEYTGIYGYIYSFYRDVMLEGEWSGTDFEVRTSAIVTDNIKSEEDVQNIYNGYSDHYDLIRGEAVNTTLTATLIETWYEKINTGSYYDFIQKQNVETYTYERREKILGNYTIETVNGKGVFANLPIEPDSESEYRLEINYGDSSNRAVQCTFYYRQMPYKQQYFNHSFRFMLDEYEFTENQRLNLRLWDNYRDFSDPAGRVFYTVSNFDFITLGTSFGTEFGITMTEDYIPSVYISGAYFDGKHVYPIRERYLSFNPVEREIILDAQTDKEKYSPGDDVTVNVTAKDKDGNIMPNTAVSLSLVDEAAFAIMPQTAAPLEFIYKDFTMPSVETYYSYTEHSLMHDGVGEMGGGDGDGVRREFKDTAAFLTGVTDNNGKVTFTAKLPDNLTTWRATIQAVGKNNQNKICAGAIKIPVISTQPFFLLPVVLPTYTEGDDFTVSSAVVGEDTDELVITAKLTGTDYEKTLTGKAGENIEFGKLPVGEYKILFSAESGENSDAIEYPVTVVEAQLEMPITRSFNLSDGLSDINPTKYPVKISFRDNEYILYGKILEKLYCSGGGRSDIKIASEFARYELGYITEEEYINSVSGLMKEGLARILPYAEQDCELTALICASTPELVNAGYTAEQLYYHLNDINSNSKTVTDCLMGLAALSEPVLLEIYDLLDNPDGLTYQDKLRLTAALALAGDYEGAKRYYTELTADSISITYNKQLDGEIAKLTANEGGGNESVISDTSIAIITASILGLPEADGMAFFLLNTPSREQTTVLQLITYLKNYHPKTEGNAVFSYNMNGKTETVELGRFRGETLSFGKEQFEKADFKVVSGDVSGSIFYTSTVSEQAEEPTITITKEYSEMGGGFKVGALIRVTIAIAPNTPRGVYMIEDVIPSGARYASTSGNNMDRSGQRVSGIISYNGSNTNTITYYIRLVTSGEYVAESAVVSDFTNNWGKSKSEIIKIEE